ncbi:hypothetical protein HX109_06100 [Galbibacter sp. BG1]|uniref:hypothetical protein n=1 Tax=Galbibacter sp. BG1 TaxID=1170699 RepID=UPI0015BFDE17|nr:hypothetical protein [Galbibacter sp. BG1]QLE01156.1 hypothetical protein HX109_06100 [Galbibacter sp. BG1]
MKKFIPLLVGLFFLSLASCELSDDDGTNFVYEAVEITNAKVPDTFELGKVYQIDFNYAIPTDCYIYNGFEFEPTDKTERAIFAISSVIERDDCKEIVDGEGTDSFNFEVRYTDTYTFNFYTGEDENGEKQYLTYEVPVKQSVRN